MKSFMLLALFATLVCCIWSVKALDESNTQPVVIGIISTLGTNRTDTVSTIKTTYSEFLEAGGATVIPIPWDLDEERFNILLESVNGVLFTGGPAFLWDEDEVTGARTYSTFQKRLNYVVNLVIQKKKKGIHYPLWAICQGFEAVGIALTGDFHILDNYVQFGKLAEIYFTPAAAESTMFQYFTQDSFDFLQQNPTMFYWHEYGFNMSVPSLYPAFAPEKWRVTGTSKDDNGKEFLTAMESVEYPIYMVMYHAERILWEANHLPKANHPSGALYATKLMAKSFVHEATKNKNKFENTNLLNALRIETFPQTDTIYGLFYFLNKNSLDDRWIAAYDSGRTGLVTFWMLLIVVIIIATGYFGYRHHKKASKTNEPLLGESIELKNKVKKLENI